MCPRLPDDPQETRGNGTLNTQETPSWIEGRQFTLGKADARCSEGASHVAALVKASQRANGFTLSTVASLVGKETPYVSKCLDAEEPHAALKMLVAAILLDKDRTLSRGLAAMAGCDLVQREELSDAEFRRRVEMWARQGKAHRASLAEALGETL